MKIQSFLMVITFILPGLMLGQGRNAIDQYTDIQTENHPAARANNKHLTYFSCGSPFFDSRNNRSYQTVEISDFGSSQCWMAENLNIGILSSASNNCLIEKDCLQGLESNCDVYGGLYSWGEMVQYLYGASNTTRWSPVPAGSIEGICPPGWHIPSDDEWGQLISMLGGDAAAGGEMKETGFTHWLSPNTGATNSSWFTALPGGVSCQLITAIPTWEQELISGPLPNFQTTGVGCVTSRTIRQV